MNANTVALSVALQLHCFNWQLKFLPQGCFTCMREGSNEHFTPPFSHYILQSFKEDTSTGYTFKYYFTLNLLLYFLEA